MGEESAAAALKLSNLPNALKIGSFRKAFDLSEELARSKLEIASTVDAVGEAAAKTSSFGTALKGFGATLAANPIFWIATGLTAVIGAWSAYQQSVRNAIELTNEATKNWTDQNTSLEDQKKKLSELKTELDSGNLSDSETYNIKSQILDIQNQIVSTYGNQAEGINLVNGNLQEQLSILDDIQAKESSETLNKNRSNYENAEKEMKRQRKYQIGATGFVDQENNKAGQEILGIAQKYKDKGIVPGSFCLHYIF